MDENIVKQACSQLGLTQKELAERMGIDDGTVRKWSSGATKTPEWAEKFIALMLENESRKKITDTLKAFFELQKTT